MRSSKKPIEPIYVTTFPNQGFLLYDGRMSFQNSSFRETRRHIGSGTGFVKFDWIPNLSIKYYFEPENISFHDAIRELNLGDFLELNDIKISAKVFTKHSSGSGNFLFGVFPEPIKVGGARRISYLIFHISNFHDYIGDWINDGSGGWSGRIVLQENNWIITIDSVRPKLREELFIELRKDGGYAITHVAKLERLNKEDFSVDEAQDILDAVSYFLAFLRGMWVGPILPVGFDHKGQVSLKIWNFYKASAYTDVMSWFPLYERGRGLNDLFLRFLKLWIDPNWQESIKFAIHWYVESNLQAGAIEGSIIMAQAAFELLFEVLLNSNKKRPKADKKVRQLCKWACLPVNPNEILGCNRNLVTLTQIINDDSNEISDLPMAISRARNDLIHPPLKHKEHPSLGPMRKETWLLSLWYLEMFLLRLFEYEGFYKSRTKFNYEGDYIRVPWLDSI